jgi:beta-N-acetylhexosaminidase
MDADRPPIHWDAVPYAEARKRQMRAYSRRHYGVNRFRLVGAKVIVQHVTVSESYSSVWNTFASNAPDAEFGERPGVCAHFVVDRRGVIHQLVSITLMCRHTVGLNHTSIGIEHVARDDGRLMSNRRQLRASLRLTRWLMDREGIRRRNVIGHNESLTSPYHRERVARFRGQTHGDMRPATMRRYRRML